MKHIFAFIVYLSMMPVSFCLGQNLNTRIGISALNGVTTGYENTAIGEQSLGSLRDGSLNTAAGFATQSRAVSSSYTVALGAQALRLNPLGNRNTAAGYEGLYSSLGNLNTVSGYQSGKFSNADRLTAVGYQSLLNSTSSENTAVGVKALSTNTTGKNNTAVGDQALLRNINGSGNTVMGDSAAARYSMWYATLIGNKTGITGSSYANTTAMGNEAVVTASNQIRFGNTAVVSIGGTVGWSTISDARFKSDICDDVPGLPFLTRLRPVSYIVNTSKVKSTLHSEKSDEASSAQQRQSGFIAQEVLQVATNLGFAFSGVDLPQHENDFYGLRYETFVVPLIKAMQELSARIEYLKQQRRIMQEQQRMIDQLTSTITDLEKRKTPAK